MPNISLIIAKKTILIPPSHPWKSLFNALFYWNRGSQITVRNRGIQSTVKTIRVNHY